jgi:GNAT superfamily N-acetyltransferase
MTDDRILGDIHRLICDVWSISGPCAEMHVGDLYWALFRSARIDRRASTRLWRDAAGAPVAAAVYPGATWCDVVIRPGSAADGVAEELIDWAEAECERKNRGQPGPVILRIGRRIHSPGQRQLLERRGFTPMTYGYPALVCDLPGRARPEPLPAGFSCLELPDAAVGSRAAAFNAAFPGESMTADDYRCLMSSPGYDRALDLVVVDASRAVASFCTLWHDAANRVGLVEPVGCDPRFRRRGLSRFVMLEGLRRLHERGATKAVVRVHNTNAAALALYEACGFGVVTATFGYEKRVVSGECVPAST